LDTVSFDGPVKMFEIIEQKTEVAVPNWQKKFFNV
jgi:hypothetical protein